MFYCLLSSFLLVRFFSPLYSPSPSFSSLSTSSSSSFPPFPRYSLSEHKLIRQKMDVEVVNVTVESDDGLRTPVKLLDCDTVSQAKEKLLDAIYKATPISQRPALTSVDLGGWSVLAGWVGVLLWQPVDCWVRCCHCNW